MLKLLSYLLKQGVATAKERFPQLESNCLGMPTVTDVPCSGADCNACKEVCPTSAINVFGAGEKSTITLDRGACIGCSLCIDTCPTGTIKRDLSTKVATRKREDLVLTNAQPTPALSDKPLRQLPETFNNSLAIRVVSCGCSACDMEIGAAGNPIFDMERFGVQVVASPRAADALMVTGPVGKGMKSALWSCYEAMAEPRVVIAAGTCAISGGVHKGGYSEANGVDPILPVDVYIPGCPPHPWSIIHGVALAMNQDPNKDDPRQ